MIVAGRWQRLEGALLFAAGIALFAQWNEALPWWAALLLFFAPDLGFAAYLAGPAVGAAIYNALHLYGGGAVLVAVGLAVAAPGLAALGALWIAHCGFDRALGYGLKSPASFTDTHLGPIGRR